MKVLITGGAGFIGTNLIKRLSAEGHDIVSIDNYSTGKKSNHIDGVKYIDGDIYELMDHIATLSTPCYQPDVVFHLAAIARIQPSFKNPKDYIKTNFNGTYNIVQFCASRGIPLIYAGSSSHHSGKFSNPYTFSKDMGEEIIQLYRKHFGLKSSIVRFYNVYGPYQLTEGGYTTLIGRWMNNIERSIPCEIYGDGSKRRDFTHVDDIVEGLIKIKEKETYAYDFELGRGQNYSVNEIAKMFNITPIYKEDKPGESQNTLCNSNVAKKILNWKPVINIEDYICKQTLTH
jgi:UDP-glucose 4-epimerase